jgi:REP element-mobilizing transposase RayT
MARKPRIEFEGAFYHVISRGNQRQKIFRSDADYSCYLDLLARYRERYGFRLYAYALMGNHVHLLVETGPAPLSKILQGLTQSYTVYFNRRYRTSGHLFQGRYKAVLCDKDEYLLTLVKYIHLNPLRAKVVDRLDAYPWSSHPAYLKKASEGDLIDPGFVLSLFAESRVKAVRRYRAFMTDGDSVDRKEIYCMVDQRVLGDEPFVQAVRNIQSQEIKEGKPRHGYSLDALAKAVATAGGATTALMRSSSKARDISASRRLLSRLARMYGYRNKDIAAFLGKDPAAVTHYLSRGECPVEIERKTLAALMG